MKNNSVVLITAPSGRSSQKIAQAILKARLAACVNILPSISSHYWWKGKLVSENESMLFVKTRLRVFKKLESVVKKVHPYAVPEIIALPITVGNKLYLKWLQDETSA